MTEKTPTHIEMAAIQEEYDEWFEEMMERHINRLDEIITEADKLPTRQQRRAYIRQQMKRP